MKGKFFLVLLITVMIGIQPMFAQSGSGVPAKEVVIDISLASDSDFIKALEAAKDVELVSLVNSGETAKTEETKTEVSDKAPSQEK